MITSSTCRFCSQLLPPPPIFSIEPPPNIFSFNFHCSSQFIQQQQHQHKKVTSSSLSPLSITLTILITLLISTSTILLIKNRMIKRRRQKNSDQSSLSVKFNGHTHHHHENRTKFLPLLSDSSSSDQTLSTPINEYPHHMIESFLPNNICHEYEQIKSDTNSSYYYSMIYCRQCANYHQTYCTCHFYELQPMLNRNRNEDLNY